MQACSILYKTKLPLLLVFNKVDVTSHGFALEWMQASRMDPIYGCKLGTQCPILHAKLPTFYID
jgi:Conserved hypothetical ATP binding protein